MHQTTLLIPPMSQPSPRDPKSWLTRAGAANTLEEALLYLNHALAIDPHHPLAGRKMNEALQQLLEHNAFLGYINENDSIYQVQTGANLVLNVPKVRAVPEFYPPQKPSPLQAAFGWLGLALLGLPLAGLGTFFSLFFVIIYIIRAYGQSLSPADQARAGIALAGSLVLAGLAFGLILLLLLHI